MSETPIKGTADESKTQPMPLRDEEVGMFTGVKIVKETGLSDKEKKELLDLERRFAKTEIEKERYRRLKLKSTT